MKKKIAILGSTGSIGKSLINIVKENKNEFKIELLTANKDYKNLLKQAKKFKVKNLIITDKKSYEILKLKTKNLNIKIFNDFSKLQTIFKKKNRLYDVFNYWNSGFTPNNQHDQIYKKNCYSK